MSYDVNIDDESILFEGEWLTRQALAELIKRKIDSQDFSISAAGGALEHLQNAVAHARKVEFKLAPDDAQRLEKHVSRAGIPMGTYVRQALLAYLAAQPDFEPTAEDTAPQPASTLTTITTEPAAPEEAGTAVELTARKSSDPAPEQQPAAEAASGDSLGDGWFKKA